MKALEIRNISKIFHEKGKEPHVVLENISFDVDSGQFVSLLGPSGCGKTTLLTILGGFQRPDDGEIMVNGVKAGKSDGSCGYVFQNYALFPWKTVRDNIIYSLKIKKTPKAEIEERLEELLQMAHLKGAEHKYPIQLSGGMQQRVAIMRALANRPQVLLLDEPLGAVDFQMREILQNELASLIKAIKTTIVMVTHDVDESVFLSDRVIVMSHDKGKIMVDLPIKLKAEGEYRNRKAPAFREYALMLADCVRQAFKGEVITAAQANSAPQTSSYGESKAINSRYQRRIM
jgi:NitT/TauT family transport system ATP-binding protein